MQGAVVGLFSRNKDDQDQEYMEEQQFDQPAPSAAPVPAPAAPNVDGVLPPGINPTPAPSSNNLSSQTTHADNFHTIASPAPTDTNTDDSAGDYIMTAPPVEQHADEWSEPAHESAPATTQVEHRIESAYEETPPAMPVNNQPSPEPVAAEESEAPAPEPMPEIEAEPEPEPPTEPEWQSEPTPVPQPETPLQTGSDPADTHEHDSEPEESHPVSVPINQAGNLSPDLEAIKRQALEQLSPLVSHLDQSPEEKFHTTMMLLQSTDDKSLINPAYEAAQAIADEKTRAQALLDIVHEINYLHQKP